MPSPKDIFAHLAGFILAEIIFIQHLDKKRERDAVAIGDVHDQRNAVFLAVNPPIDAFVVAHGLEGRVSKRTADTVLGVNGDEDVCFGLIVLVPVGATQASPLRRQNFLENIRPLYGYGNQRFGSSRWLPAALLPFLKGTS